MKDSTSTLAPNLPKSVCKRTFVQWPYGTLYFYREGWEHCLLSCLPLLCYKSVGQQDLPPQDVPLWHVDYCELKAIKAQKAQVEPLMFPLTD